MYVVNAKIGDKVAVGDDVEVTILSVRKGRYRLGIISKHDSVLIHKRECENLNRIVSAKPNESNVADIAGGCDD